MSRRTQLYQAPRSPLIQGRSKLEKPLWRSWVGGWLVAVAFPLVTGWASLLGDSRVPPGAAFERAFDAWVAGLPLLALAAAVGAFGGVVFARAWGWRVRWPLGAGFGVALWYVVLLVRVLMRAM
ncbi:MAG: hypothetical protein Q8K89_03585 [Actinomycetota bacterium]|nr:hypothetical protein [Actinomycetota bacterium]